MNYVLYGEENYRIKQTLKTILKEYKVLEDDFDLNSFDARKASMDQIIEAASTIPFFNDYKVVIVEHANFLSANNEVKMDVSLLETYLKAPLESTVLVLWGNFNKLDARKSIVKQIKKSFKVMEFKRLDVRGKKEFVESEIKNRGIIIDEDAKTWLIKNLPLDLMSIQNELDKLSLYGKRIDKEAITHLATRTLSDDVFSLVDAVVNKNSKKALQLWHDFQQINIEVIYLVALMGLQFRFLFQVKHLMNQNKSKEEIAKILSAHPYRVQLSMDIAYRLTSDEILKKLADVASLDQKLKSGKIKKELGFELFLLNL